MKFSVSVALYNQNKYKSRILFGMVVLTCLISLLVAIPLFNNIITKTNGSLINNGHINAQFEKISSHQDDLQVQEASTFHRHQMKHTQLTQQNHATRLLEQNEQTSRRVQKYILLLIIVFFVGVPATATLIFLGLILYKKCTQTQDHLQPASEINLEEYNIDEIGPYLANSNDNCSICLDTQVNIRTFCGHLFHAPCLKVWYDKKAQQNRKPTCPVCVGETTNPIKIYCKKCFVSVKLDKLIYASSQATISQFDSLQCNQCKKPQNDTSFTQNSANDHSETQKENSFKKNDFQNHLGPISINENGKKISKLQILKKVSNKTQDQINSDVKINVNNDL